MSIEAISHLASSTAPPSIHWYQFAVIALAVLLDISRLGVSLAAARRFSSPALRGNALHFGADMVGSVAVLAGLVLVHEGVQEGDALAALAVALIILLAAGRLIGENANVLMDRTPDRARAAAERAISELGADVELRRLRLRESAGRYFADVVVSVPPGQAVVEGHRTADLIEGAVEAALPGSDIVVHVEPRRSGLDLRDRVLAIALAEPLVREAHDITIFEQDGTSSVSLHLKFPHDLGLREAHEIAERIEREIAERPGVAEVQTHLEPLERPLGESPSDGPLDALAIAAVRRHVLARTGAPPRRARMLSTASGRVLFLTVVVDGASSIAAAHQLAGDLEEELRQLIPDLAEVVVHTEP